MTQPARQEPSMEEILASIRRIIAEDDPATQSPPTEAASTEPLRAAAPLAMPAARPAASAGPAMRDEEADGKLAELRGCRGTRRWRSVRQPNRQTRPAPALQASGPRAFFLPRRRRWSMLHSMRLPKRRRRAGAARSRSWSANSCGRCSRPGSMTICRPSSSGWCARRSNASRAHGTEQSAVKKF
jgi:hypothetical protein